MATPNPLEHTHSRGAPPDPSAKTFHIGGILTTVYGLDELPPQCSSLACLWLLHPRLQTQACMAPLAAQTIAAWNARGTSKGLLAVSFDQRNHGTRQVDELANEAWRQGNPRHAQDMFSIYHGTALDCAQLLSYLPAYIFPAGQPHPVVNQHLALGISLGGHSTWHCLLQDPRITAGVSVIGCPDYTALMSQRAEKSKLTSWTSSDPPGSRFLGSHDFPPALVDAVAQWDPAGLLMRALENSAAPTDAEKSKLDALLRSHLRGKRILCLSGGADKLVPYACGKDFLDFLKKFIKEDEALGLVLEDLVYEGVGHEMTPAMSKRAVDFICETLAAERPVVSAVKESKI
ncbi:uncharacterized protein K452DRAFT_361218 [Aplosporella prunicola CBS 121167]|uniref:AB hydrolase-1 domain-containing protein n=1 Tax=Aplosporella prunicola CBS 121167 TaxID=1176127 RepID=A0A6A6B5M6_9PEZI|nr:uncharacterized protein K452DRAFT_361218 [Aplosporella prunicola CBS 121167]KAF2138544.1 hypothetical protein K452DRAFT_361218 [Aplosporella prunicola CBS 121167]